jgi:hypothetical protein
MSETPRLCTICSPLPSSSDPPVTTAMNILAAIFLLASAGFFVSAQCPLPTTYKWVDSGVLAVPKQIETSLQDFTHVPYSGKHLVYASYAMRNASYGTMVLGPFSEWSDMASVDQIQLPDGVAAPTLFFFQPGNIWVLAYQGGPRDYAMSYMLSSDPTDAKSWSFAWPLWKIRPPAFPIYPTLIGDSTNMYLFWIDYHVNKMFRSSQPNQFFPRGFSYQADVVMKNFEETARLAGVQVYSVKDMAQYLMIVEVIGDNGRFYRSFTSTSLDGSWLPQATSESSPFAGKANSGAAWTDHISNGDIIRSNPDQTFTIDACNLQLLYQGDLKSDAYGAIYRPGLLTLNATASATTTTTTTTTAPVTTTTARTKSGAKTVTATTTETIKKTIIRTTTKLIATKTKSAFVTETWRTTKTTTRATTKTRTKTATKITTKSAIRTKTKFVPVPFTVRTTVTLVSAPTTNKRATKPKHTASGLV